MTRGYILKNINKIYTVEAQEHVVLNDVNLEIQGDKVTVLLGKSGCGKTTLLRLLAQLESPTKGEIIYRDEEENILPKVGMVFQESRLMPWLTVEENIKFSCQEKQLSEERLVSYLRLMGLEKFRKAYPITLSGGMAQRVSIARALAYDPHLLLMDEPFSALDYFTRMTMQNELITIHQTTKKGIVFVTHNIDEALALGHEILVLRQGQPIERVEIPFDYNRDLNQTYFRDMKKKLLDLF